MLRWIELKIHMIMGVALAANLAQLWLFNVVIGMAGAVLEVFDLA